MFREFCGEGCYLQGSKWTDVLFEIVVMLIAFRSKCNVLTLIISIIDKWIASYLLSSRVFQNGINGGLSNLYNETKTEG